MKIVAALTMFVALPALAQDREASKIVKDYTRNHVLFVGSEEEAVANYPQALTTRQAALDKLGNLRPSNKVSKAMRKVQDWDFTLVESETVKDNFVLVEKVDDLLPITGFWPQFARMFYEPPLKVVVGIVDLPLLPVLGWREEHKTSRLSFSRVKKLAENTKLSQAPSKPQAN